MQKEEAKAGEYFKCGLIQLGENFVNAYIQHGNKGNELDLNYLSEQLVKQSSKVLLPHIISA